MQRIDHTLFPFYRFDNLTVFPHLLHFVSSGAHTIGFSDSLAPGTIAANRCLLAEAVGFDPHTLVTGHQVHGTRVALVTASDAGRGALNPESRLPDTDALVSDCTSVCLMVLSADCVPILLYDPKRHVIAAVHAGWRGTATGIVAETVSVMQRAFHCSPADLLAGIAPSIGPCCFDVGGEVADRFHSLSPDFVLPAKTAGKYRVDLWEANRRQLLDAGLAPDRIEVAGLCSVCHPDRFFSYRRDGKAAGRFGAGIALLPSLVPVD